MADLTDEEIAELRKLDREASPIPWAKGKDEDEWGSDSIRSLALQPKFESWGPGVAVIHTPADEDCPPMSGADRAFVIAARNALPRLLDEVERCRAERRRPGVSGTGSGAGVGVHYERKAPWVLKCPECGCLNPTEPRNHEPDCERGKLLRERR